MPSASKNSMGVGLGSGALGGFLAALASYIAFAGSDYAVLLGLASVSLGGIMGSVYGSFHSRVPGTSPQTKALPFAATLFGFETWNGLRFSGTLLFGSYIVSVVAVMSLVYLFAMARLYEKYAKQT